MNRVFLLITALGVFFSCAKDENSHRTSTPIDLIGEWKLIEVYADPGGGGSFVPVVSEKRVTFHPDATISSNGELCTLSIGSDQPTSGSYSLSDSTFSSGNCMNPDFAHRFSQNDSILIIHYPCIEPCQAKYRKE